MIQEKPLAQISNQLANRLIKAAGSGDLETAAAKVVDEYIEMKISQQEQVIARMQEKWKMTFEEFEERMKDNTLGKDIYSWQVERDDWEWDAAVSLLQKYQALK